MPVQIARLTEADIPGVVSAIQKAFANDPYNDWQFDKSKFNPRRNAASLAARCRWGMRNALFYAAREQDNGKVLGVAMWLPPEPLGRKQTWYEWLEGWRFWLSQVGVNLRYGRGGLNVKRYYIFKDAQARAHRDVWTDPRGYYFLNIIVVVPEAQGRGIGKQLVAVVTDQADREGMPCYLESSKDKPNTSIYESWGFKLAKQMDCDDDGAVCKLFCMTRDPKSS